MSSGRGPSTTAVSLQSRSNILVKTVALRGSANSPGETLVECTQAYVNTYKFLQSGKGKGHGSQSYRVMFFFETPQNNTFG